MSEQEAQVVDIVDGEITELMKVNADAFASVALPDVHIYNFPLILLSFWQALVDSVAPDNPMRFPKLAIGIPRGHAKSTIVKLFILYCILFTKKQFILVICAKEDLAGNVIKDIVDMLDSPNIRALFGDWRVNLTTDKVEQKVFEFCGRPIILGAAGSGSSFRGLNLKNARPDVMVFDDAQTKECAESETESKNFVSWFTSTAMKAKSPKHCTYIYMGNMYKQLVLKRDADDKPTLMGCMLHNLKMMKNWKSYISGAILADGSVLWPELHPKSVLLAELEDDLELEAGAEWFAEVQNDPTYIPKQTLNPENILVRKKSDISELDEIPHSRYIIIDPSLGKKKSDDIAVGVFEVIDDKPIMASLHIQRCSQPELVKFCIDLAIEVDAPLIISEDYGMQGALVQWFEFWAKQMQLEGVEFRGINRGRMSKNSAILDYLKSLNGQQQVLDEAVFSRVVDQGTNFDPRVTTNSDDILDVGYYGNRAWGIEELRELAMLPLYSLHTLESGDTQVYHSGSGSYEELH